tara:strand:+ start:126 stop:290 length:165 start_codon:yes stop_codon:yes gene_type:complete
MKNDEIIKNIYRKKNNKDFIVFLKLDNSRLNFFSSFKFSSKTILRRLVVFKAKS